MHLLINNVATNLKNPTSSKNIDNIVIEKKITNILIGFIADEDMIPSNDSLIVKLVNNKIHIAPSNATIQNVFKDTFFILIFGRKSIDNINNKQVMQEIIIVGNITFSFNNPTRLYSYNFEKERIKLIIFSKQNKRCQCTFKL